MVTTVAAAAWPTTTIAAPVPVPNWNDTSQGAIAVDDAGRAVVLFPHGEHVWEAAVTPDGQIVSLARVESQRNVDGPTNLAVAMNDAGDVIAGWIGFNGQEPASGKNGQGAFGFVQRPFAARWTWGAAPGRGTPVDRGLIDADNVQVRLRPDGLAGLLYSADEIRGDTVRTRLALLPRGGPPVVRQVPLRRGRAAYALSLDLDGAGRFTVAWNDRRPFGGDEHLGVVRTDEARVFGSPQVFPAGQRALGVAPVLVDDRGDQVVVWERRANHRSEVRVAGRASGAGAFEPPHVIARTKVEHPLAGSAIGPAGHVAVLLQEGRHLSIVVRSPSGELSPPIALPGAYLGPTDAPNGGVGVDATGTVTVAYTVALSDAASAQRTVRIAPGAAPVATDIANCDALALALAPSGAGALTLQCSPSPTSRTSTPSVLTLPATPAR